MSKSILVKGKTEGQRFFLRGNKYRVEKIEKRNWIYIFRGKSVRRKELPEDYSGLYREYGEKGMVYMLNGNMMVYLG